MSSISSGSGKFNLQNALETYQNDISKKSLSAWDISFDQLERICKKKSCDQDKLLIKVLSSHVTLNLVSIILDS